MRADATQATDELHPIVSNLSSKPPLPTIIVSGSERTRATIWLAAIWDCGHVDKHRWGAQSGLNRAGRATEQFCENAGHRVTPYAVYEARTQVHQIEFATKSADPSTALSHG